MPQFYTHDLCHLLQLARAAQKVGSCKSVHLWCLWDWEEINEWRQKMRFPRVPTVTDREEEIMLKSPNVIFREEKVVGLKKRRCHWLITYSRMVMVHHWQRPQATAAVLEFIDTVIPPPSSFAPDGNGMVLFFIPATSQQDPNYSLPVAPWPFMGPLYPDRKRNIKSPPSNTTLKRITVIFNKV